jgi:hypothetical protein
VAAPPYVPNTLAEQPRRGLDLPPADRWTSSRPGELGPAQPTGPHLGHPGPDQGYALRLVRHFDDKLVVPADEHREDVVAGCLGVATARAALFGRAPVVHDLDVAFRVWGYLGAAPDELVAFRKPRFASVAHHYNDQRAITDQVPEATLRLTHGEVARRYPAEWRTLLGVG